MDTVNFSEYTNHIAHLYSYLLRTSPPLRQAHAYLLHGLSWYYMYLYPSLYPLYRLSVSLLDRTVVPLVNQAIILIFPQLSSRYSSKESSASALNLQSIIALVVLLFISMKALDMVRRTVMFWVGLAFKVLFWGVVLSAGLYVYERGLEESIRDIGWAYGVLQGLEGVGEKRGAVKGWRAEERARGVWTRGF